MSVLTLNLSSKKLYDNLDLHIFIFFPYNLLYRSNYSKQNTSGLSNLAVLG